MKKATITVDGTQNFGNGDTNRVELVTEGTVEITNDKCIITYKESELTGMKGTITNITAEKSGIVSLSRVGGTNSCLVFEEGKKHISYYDTEDGAFNLSVFSKHVDAEIKENFGEINVCYLLESDGNPIGENDIRIRFKVE